MRFVINAPNVISPPFFHEKERVIILLYGVYELVIAVTQTHLQVWKFNTLVALVDVPDCFLGGEFPETLVSALVLKGDRLTNIRLALITSKARLLVYALFIDEVINSANNNEKEKRYFIRLIETFNISDEFPDNDISSLSLYSFNQRVFFVASTFFLVAVTWDTLKVESRYDLNKVVCGTSDVLNSTHKIASLTVYEGHAVFVLENGQAHYFLFEERYWRLGGPRVVFSKGILLPVNNSKIAALSDAKLYLRVAISDTTGTVHMLRLDAKKPKIISKHCIKTDDNVSTEISHLSWSRDAEMVCCLTRKGLITLLHYSGSCVFRRALCADGFGGVAWGLRDYFLYILSATGNLLYVYSTARVSATCIVGFKKECANSGVIFVSPDAVLSIADRFGNFKKHELSKDFLVENYACFDASLSPDGLNICVRSNNVLALLDVQNDNWKYSSGYAYLGSVDGKAGSPLWLNTLVFGLFTLSPASSAGRICIISRLSLDTVLASAQLSAPPLSASATIHSQSSSRTLIAVLAVDGSISQLEVLTLCDDVLRPERTACHIITLRSIQGPTLGVKALLCPHIGDDSALVLKGDGEIALASPEGISEICVDDGSFVAEMCIDVLCGVLAAFTVTGLHCIPFASFERAGKIKKYFLKPIPPSPLCVFATLLPSCGTAVALRSVPIMCNNETGHPWFAPTAFYIPYAHMALRAVPLAAVRSLAVYDRAGTYIIVADSLIGSIMTTPAVNETYGQQELEKFIEILSRFRDFPRALTCAIRKLDAAEWPRLFRAARVGSLEFFSSCVERGDFITALSFLRVLLETSVQDVGYLVPPVLRLAMEFLRIHSINHFYEVMRFLFLVTVDAEAPALEDLKKDWLQCCADKDLVHNALTKGLDIEGPFSRSVFYHLFCSYNDLNAGVKAYSAFARSSGYAHSVFLILALFGESPVLLFNESEDKEVSIHTLLKGYIDDLCVPHAYVDLDERAAAAVISEQPGLGNSLLLLTPTQQAIAADYHIYEEISHFQVLSEELKCYKWMTVFSLLLLDVKKLSSLGEEVKSELIETIRMEKELFGYRKLLTVL